MFKQLKTIALALTMLALVATVFATPPSREGPSEEQQVNTNIVLHKSEVKDLTYSDGYIYNKEGNLVVDAWGDAVIVQIDRSVPVNEVWLPWDVPREQQINFIILITAGILLIATNRYLKRQQVNWNVPFNKRE